MKATYLLEDNHAKLLIGMKLKKMAAEWFHSKPEYLSMSFEELIGRLKSMFQHHESKAALRKKSENRVWKRDESFHEYVHEKIILGNRVPVDQDELIENLVDGIPDVALRDQARIQGFATTDSLLRAFEKVTLRGRDAADRDRRDGRGCGAVKGSLDGLVGAERERGRAMLPAAGGLVKNAVLVAAREII